MDETTLRAVNAYLNSTPLEVQKANERSYREKIANGIPSDSPCCERHARMIVDVRMRPRDRNDASTEITAIGPQLHYAITKETALLPFCYESTKWELQLQDGQTPPVFDSCLCATWVHFSSCWYCQMENVEELKRTATQQRTTPSEDGRMNLKCACGSTMKGPECVRKCAGCNGMVVAVRKRLNENLAVPLFTNMAGMGVVFQAYSDVVFRIFPRSTHIGSRTAPATGAAFQQSSEHTMGYATGVHQPHSQLVQATRNNSGSQISPIMRNTQITENKTRLREDEEIVVGRESDQKVERVQTEGNSFGGSANLIRASPTNQDLTLTATLQRSAQQQPAQGQYPPQPAVRATPIFTPRQMQAVQSLHLECKQLYRETMLMPITAFDLVQEVLDQNPKAWLSLVTSSELFAICGFSPEVSIELREELEMSARNGGNTRESVALTVAMKHSGLLD